MSKLPRITECVLVVALKRASFEVIRTKGNHRFLRHPDGRTTVVPVHAGEDIGIELLSKILRDTDLGEKELRKWL